MIIIQAPTQIAERLKKFSDGWQELAPDKSFGGMTLPEFKVKVQPSLAIREEIKNLESQLSDAQNRRADADAASIVSFRLAVNSLKGDPTVGDDSSLYEAAGYIRQSEKKSGLSRKTKAAPVAQLKAA